MDKTKILILILILIFVSGISGCPVKGPLGRKSKDVISRIGLIIEFLPNQPPDKIYVTEDSIPFNVALRLLNYGTEPVSGFISVSDSLAEHYDGVYGEESFYIDAAEEFEKGKIVPSEEIIKFESFSYSYDAIRDEGSTRASIYVTIDTDYVFDVSKQICISKLDSIRDCNKENSRISGKDLGRGALTLPVTVSKIEKEVVSVSEDTAQLKFDIFVKDVGGGFINNEEGAIDNFELTFDRATSVKCLFGKRIKLKNKERKISCIVNLDVSDFVQYADERFNIYFEYPYRFIATKQIMLEPVEE